MCPVGAVNTNGAVHQTQPRMMLSSELDVTGHTVHAHPGSGMSIRGGYRWRHVDRRGRCHVERWRPQNELPAHAASAGMVAASIRSLEIIASPSNKSHAQGSRPVYKVTLRNPDTYLEA